MHEAQSLSHRMSRSKLELAAASPIESGTEVGSPGIGSPTGPASYERHGLGNVGNASNSGFSGDAAFGSSGSSGTGATQSTLSE
jgi:hypothetical protein